MAYVWNQPFLLLLQGLFSLKETCRQASRPRVIFVLLSAREFLLCHLGCIYVHVTPSRRQSILCFMLPSETENPALISRRKLSAKMMSEISTSQIFLPSTECHRPLHAPITHTFHRSHSFLLFSSQCQFILAVHRIIRSNHRCTDRHYITG